MNQFLQNLAKDRKQLELSRKLTEAGYPISSQAINQWVANGEIPPRRAKQVAKVTGKSLQEIIPEFFA